MELNEQRERFINLVKRITLPRSGRGLNNLITELEDMLIDGFDPNFIDNSLDGLSPLIKFIISRINLDYIDILVSTGNADVNLPDSNMTTPLMFASEYNRDDVVEYLIDKGANPYNVDEFGKTALDYADMEDIKDILKKYMELPIRKDMLEFTKSTLDPDSILLQHFNYEPELLEKIYHDLQRKREEQLEEARAARFLETIGQYGSGKRSSNGKRSSKKKKKKTKKKNKK